MVPFAVVALWLKMNAEETSVLRLDRNPKQLAFEGRPGPARRAAASFTTEVGAVLANTEAPMRSTCSHRGQHLMQGVMHRGLRFRVERAHGAHQNFKGVARNHFIPFIGQAERDAAPICLGSLSNQVPTCLKRLNGL